MDAENRAELSEKFGNLLTDDALIDQLVDLCRNYNLTGENLFYKWEAKYLTVGISSIRPPVTKETIEGLKEQLLEDAKQVKKQAQIAQRGRGALGGLQRKDLFNLGRGSIKAEPLEHKPFASTSTSFSTVPDAKWRTAGPSKVTVSCPDLQKTTRRERSYRYMYEKISERSLALDDRIDDFAELVQSVHNIEDFGDPAASSEEKTTVVGRIVFDADSTSASPVKLNEAILTLESSRSMGSGARIPLRLDPSVRLKEGKKGIGGVGFFPGAIVSLRGKNGGGGWFTVTEVLPLPPLPAPDVLETNGSFSVAVACGPFTADADLNYEPWKQLLAKWKTEKPEAIVLIGPFVDCAHTSIKNGEVDMLPAELFRTTILEPLQQLLDSLPGTVVVTVPSVRDIVSDHAVFPQAELASNVFDDPRIYSVPNPSQFTLNGVSFGVSSVDVLFHLRKEEFFRPMSEINSVALEDNETPASDAMAKLCRHILQQRSFYPIFPPPLDLAHEVNLDVTHSARLKLAEDAAPAVLVLPSKLKQFHKTIDQTAVVNPSFATKGTYANLKIAAGKLAQVDICKLSE
ncbi:DNA polymerase alpha subunit B [Phanerochaete sordida]|uniref:DNA polymerase alpha subunit B n=1 Tax=Phanerochaete sordida TaxID=48140 RepID=A0A9P3LF85_9APHY|nr:DNA polymerase alpha subunit B [Phanerochaete sordida]